MNQTKLNNAGIASNILFIAFAACFTSILILEGDPTVFNCFGWVALIWYDATSAIICVLYKLGFRSSSSWSYAIARLMGNVLIAIACASFMASNYVQSNYMGVALFGLYFFFVVFCACCTYFAGAPTWVNDTRIQQAEESFMPGLGIWMTFISVIILLFFFTFLTLGTVADATRGVGDANVVTLYIATCIILVLLVVLSFMLAEAPSMAHGIAEPLAPEEETATTKTDGELT